MFKIHFKRVLLYIVLGVSTGLLDVAFDRFCTRILGIPLYLDVIFMLAAALLGGALPGIIAAAVCHICYYIDTGIISLMFYGLCSVAGVVCTALFMRLFPIALGRFRIDRPVNETLTKTFKQLNTEEKVVRTIAVLLILALVQCIVISIVGGITNTIIDRFQSEAYFSPVETWNKLFLLQMNIPLLWASILARIPPNLIDRPISVTLAYFIAWGVKHIYFCCDKARTRVGRP
jgi:hypothetical protein